MFGGKQKKGVDLIRHEPLSDTLKLERVTWNGEFYTQGNEAHFFGLDMIMNPTTDAQRRYNNLISRASRWFGTRRPVVIATETMSFLITPAFFGMISKLRTANYSLDDAQIVLKKIGKLLKEIEKNDPDHKKIEKVVFLETIKPNDISLFLKDVTPKKLSDHLRRGRRMEKLKNTKPQGPDTGLGMKIAVGGAALLMIAGIFFLWRSGIIQKYVDGMNAVGLCLELINS